MNLPYPPIIVAILLLLSWLEYCKFCSKQILFCYLITEASIAMLNNNNVLCKY